MPSDFPTPVVSTDWLAAHLGDADLRIVDGTYFLPTHKRDAAAEFRERHIPEAIRFDIDDVKDPADPLPHMVPTPELFADKAGAMGLGDGARIVVYDAHGMMSAARVWWMFRLYGHDGVAVLDGGLPKWLAEGRALEGGEATTVPARFTPRFRPGLVRDVEAVRRNLTERSAQVVDARSRGRFLATEPEIRPGLRGGHIPGSANIPFTELLAADQTLLPADRLAARFREAGVDLAKPVVTSCGSGVTACVLALGAYLAGKQDVAVYDGSWTEWGGRTDTPIEP